MPSPIDPAETGAPHQEPRRDGQSLSRLKLLQVSTARILAGFSGKASSFVTNLTGSTRLIYATVAALAMAIVLTAGLIATNLHDEVLATAQHDNRRLATVLAAQTERLLQSVDVVLKAIVRDAGLEKLSTPDQFRTAIGTRAWHDEFVSRLSGLTQAVWLTAVDADGKLANMSLSWPLPAYTVTDRPYFVAMRRDRSPEQGISEPMVSRADGSRVVLVMRRISAPDGRFLGLLTATVQLEYVEAFYAAFGLPPGMRISLVRHDGLILTSLPGVEKLSVPAFPPTSDWYRTVAAGGGEYWRKGVLDGEMRLVSTRPVNGFPVVVDVAVTRTALFAAWWNKLAGIGLIVVFALAGLAGLLRVVLVQYDKLRNANDVLEKSERRFRTLTATAQDAIITIDGSGTVYQWNDAAERILGYSAREAIGRQVHELLASPHLRDQAHQRFSVFSLTGEGRPLGKTVETTALRKDGTEIDIELSVARARIGTAWEAIGILRDITQRKQAEKALKTARDDLAEQEHHLRSILDNVPSLISYWGRDQRNQFANRAYEHWFGINPAAMPGRNLREVLGEEIYPMVLPHIEAALRGEPQTFEHTVDASSNRRTALACYVPNVQNGEVLGFYALVSDITSVKQAEAAMRAAKEELVELASFNQHIIEQAPIGILLFQQNGQCILANPAAADIVGTSPDALMAQNFNELESWQTSGLLEPAHCALKENRMVKYEDHSRSSFGKELYISCRFVPILRSGAQHLLLIVDDVTERKFLEMELERRNQLLAEREADLRSVMDNMPSLIGYWDRNLCSRFANHAYKSWFGVDPDGITGWHISEVIGEERYRLNLPYLTAALNGEAQEFERAIPCPDGSFTRHALVRYIPDIRDGEVHGFYALVFDVTTLKDTEAALRAARDQMADMAAFNERVINEAPIGIVLYLADGQCVLANPAAARMAGTSQQVMLAQNFRELEPTLM